PVQACAGEDRFRQHQPAHSGSADAAAAVHSLAGGKTGGALCNGSSSVRTRRRDGAHSTPVRHEVSQVGRGNQRGSQLRDLTEWRKDALPAGRPLDHYITQANGNWSRGSAAALTASANRKRSQNRRPRSKGGSESCVEADVSRSVAHRTRLLLRSELSRAGLAGRSEAV